MILFLYRSICKRNEIRRVCSSPQCWVMAFSFLPSLIDEVFIFSLKLD